MKVEVNEATIENGSAEFHDWSNIAPVCIQKKELLYHFHLTSWSEYEVLAHRKSGLNASLNLLLGSEQRMKSAHPPRIWSASHHTIEGSPRSFNRTRKCPWADAGVLKLTAFVQTTWPTSIRTAWACSPIGTRTSSRHSFASAHGSRINVSIASS